MVEGIKIKSLFGLYDYDIVLNKKTCDGIHFLTGPNGYGKTTILDMIAYVVCGEFRKLVDIPFDQCSLLFDGDTSLSIDRLVKYPELEEDTDEYMKPNVRLKVALIRGNKTIESMAVNDGCGDFDNSFSADFRIDNRGVNIDMFLKSMICHYITDARILERKSDISIDHESFFKIDLRKYSARVNEILNNPIEAKEYSDRLSFFKRTIDSLVFANKTMELQPVFGFRFVSTDADRTIIPLDKLSSGEKHLLIQLCELLFMAKTGALVLIDEPELSLHMAWQYQYMKMIKGLATLCGYQFIIATHSPQVFNAEWSYTTDLYKISKGRN
jgi:predicted ATP-binding protein involved in virulence